MSRIVLAIVLLIVVAMLFGLSVGVFSGAGVTGVQSGPTPVASSWSQGPE